MPLQRARTRISFFPSQSRIQTYLWILFTHKTKKQKGNVMLFDTSGDAFWKKLPKAIGDKRRTIEGSEDTILRQFAA